MRSCNRVRAARARKKRSVSAFAAAVNFAVFVFSCRFTRGSSENVTAKFFTGIDGLERNSLDHVANLGRKCKNRGGTHKCSQRKDQCYRGSVERYSTWCEWKEWWKWRTGNYDTYDCPNAGKCVDCVGRWGGWSQCGQTRPGENFKGCGKTEQYRQYSVTTRQGPKGSKACSTSHGARETKSCQFEGASKGCGAPVISITNAPKVVSSTPYDFKLSIKQPRLCGSYDCRLSSGPFTRRDVRCSGYLGGGSIPGRRTLSSSEFSFNGKVYVPTTPGTYTLEVSCDIWDNANNRFLPHTKTTKRHTFQVVKGCDEKMMWSSDEIVRHVLLTSNHFLTAPCEDNTLVSVRESIFRRFDVAPTDGFLTYDEIGRGLTLAGASTELTREWNSDADPIKISLGQFLTANREYALWPVKCTQLGRPTTRVKGIRATHTMPDSPKSYCDKHLKKLEATWDFEGQLNGGDRICVYVNGQNVARYETPTRHGGNPTENKYDKRSSYWTPSGVNGMTKNLGASFALYGIQDTRSSESNGNRRVVCVSVAASGSDGTKYMCAGGLYYDSSAIDVGVAAELAGVTFTFRDTATKETGFEIERKRIGTETSDEFQSVVLVESTLKGCATEFSSITYLDREAVLYPNYDWVYRVTTKIGDGNTVFKSEEVSFSTPWMSIISGTVYAGASDVPVRNIRICATFSSSEIADDTPTNFAAFRPVRHSNSAKQNTAYVVTAMNSGSGISTLAFEEYLRIDVGMWASFETVRVCVANPERLSSSHVAAYVSEHDPGSGHYGNECTFVDDEIVDNHQTSGDSTKACVNFVCKGKSLKTLHGQHVTIVAVNQTADVIKVTKVFAEGRKTNCPYTVTSDEYGDFDIDIRDTTGDIPVKTTMHIGAHKEDVFSPTTETMIDSSMSVDGHRETHVTSPHRVLLVVTEDLSGTSSTVSTNADTYSLADVTPHDPTKNVTKRMLANFITKLTNFTNEGVAIMSDELWEKFDADGDGALNATEFDEIATRMEQKQLVVEPRLVYQPRLVTHMSDFVMGVTWDDFLNEQNIPRHSKHDASWDRFFELKSYEGSSVKLANVTGYYSFTTASLNEKTDLYNQTVKQCEEISNNVTANEAAHRHASDMVNSTKRLHEEALANLTTTETEFEEWRAVHNGSIVELHEDAHDEWHSSSTSYNESVVRYNEAKDSYDKASQSRDSKIAELARLKSDRDSAQRDYDTAITRRDDARRRQRQAQQNYDGMANQGYDAQIRVYDSYKAYADWWRNQTNSWHQWFYPWWRWFCNYLADFYQGLYNNCPQYLRQYRADRKYWSERVTATGNEASGYNNEATRRAGARDNANKAIIAQEGDISTVDTQMTTYASQMTDELEYQETLKEGVDAKALERDRLATERRNYELRLDEYEDEIERRAEKEEEIKEDMETWEEEFKETSELRLMYNSTLNECVANREQYASEVDSLRSDERRYGAQVQQLELEVDEYETHFADSQAQRKTCENLVLIRRESASLPVSADDWNSLYSGVTQSSQSARLSDCRALNVSEVNPIMIGEEKSKYLLPILWFKSSANVITLERVANARLGQKSQLSAAEARDLFHRVTKDHMRLRLTATKHVPDIVHKFDQGTQIKDSEKKPTSSTATDKTVNFVFSNYVKSKFTKLKVQHKRIEEKEITDDTVAIVTGAVVFPRHLAAGSSDCGLYGATIKVFEPEGKPEEYKTDENGWFEIALARGKTFTFQANYREHTICYSGSSIASNSIEDALTSKCAASTDIVTLKDLGDGQTIFFTDVTPVRVDLGLYQGECDSRYSGASFKVAPISGCHAAVVYTSEDIATGWRNVDETSRFDNWPLAAMDYAIELVEAPSVDGVDTMIANEAWKDSCATEPGDILSYFRDRDASNRFASFQNDQATQKVRYEYHGFICVDIKDIAAIDSRRDTEVCLDEDESVGSLTVHHLIGETTTKGFWDTKIDPRKDLKLRVFELHRVISVDGRSGLNECTTLPSEAAATGSTMLSYRQNVGEEDDNPCHPNLAGGEACDFQVEISTDSGADEGLVLWPDNKAKKTSTTITPGLPNLAGNHRRFIDVRVERYDMTKRVTAVARRELVTIGSKQRGGGDLSDDVFWATVPLEGLVYTVVHDPPGGDSYAEMSVGSVLRIDIDKSNDRSASSSNEPTFKLENPPADVDTSTGANAGIAAEAAFGIPVDWFGVMGGIESKADGPKVRLASSFGTSWALETITDRVIRSSQSPALPGRAGDTILGGGVELVYKISDVLDVVKDARTLDKPCLYISVAITWLPRKPTSYLYNVASIEKQIIPNLKFLWSVVAENGVAKDGSEMYYACKEATCKPEETTSAWSTYLDSKIATWRRTLAWASPMVHKDGTKKNATALEDTMTASSSALNPLMKGVSASTDAFTDALVEEDLIQDLFDEVSLAWDNSVWMMPYNGVGPPPFFGDGKMGGFAQLIPGVTDYALDSRYWEPKASDSEDVKDPWDRVIAKTISSDKFMGKWSRGVARNIIETPTGIYTGKNAARRAATNTVVATHAAAAAEDVAYKSTTTAASGKVATFADGAKEKMSNFKAGLRKCASPQCKVAIATAAAAVIAGISVGATLDAPNSYQYVSHPRKTFKGDVPKASTVFRDRGGDVVTFTYGMPDEVVGDVLRKFNYCEKVTCEDGELTAAGTSLKIDASDGWGEDSDKSYRIRDKNDVTNRVVASFTGAKGKTGMRLRKTTTMEEQTILLSFSGGGHSVDYAFSSDNTTVSGVYDIGVDFSGVASNDVALSFSGYLGYAITAGMIAMGIDSESKSTFEKSIATRRVFSWNRHDVVNTLYTLGDPEFGDKFVVQVGADKRFGTPAFYLQGGRSSCPGEILTIWREEGVSMSLEMPFNKDLGPDERALLRLTIQNGTPYREASLYGLRIVDGLAESVTQIIDAAYDVLEENTKNDASDILDAIRATAKKTIAKDSIVVQKIIADAAQALEITKKQSAALEFPPAVIVVAAAVQAARTAPPMGDEFGDVEFRINGKRVIPLQEVVPFKFVDGDALSVQKRVTQTSFTLAVKPIGNTNRQIRYAQLRIQSLCETALHESKNFDRGVIASTTYLQPMTWSQRCPEVAFDQKTINDYSSAFVSPAASEPLLLKVYNPNKDILWPGDSTNALTNVNLKFARVQFRSMNVGEWISIRSDDSLDDDKKVNVLCGASRTEGCTLAWDVNSRYERLLSGFKDGLYEVRVKNFCTGGSAFADPSVHSFTSQQTLALTVDTVAPLAHQRSADVSDGTVGVEYYEGIDCSEQQVTLTKVKDDSCVDVHEPVSLHVIKKSFTIKCFNAGGKGHWVMQYPSAASGSYEAVVSSIKDTSGNVAKDYAFTFTAGAESTDCASVLCPVNHRVDSSHTCVPCEKGSTRIAGDDSRGGETKCDSCAAGYFYDDTLGACASCASSDAYGPGYTSSGGQMDVMTKCNKCALNYISTGNEEGRSVECAPCPAGSFSWGGDAKKCEPLFCQHGNREYVVNHECVSCPKGAARSANYTSVVPGDDMSGDDTSCDVCDKNYYRADATSACVSCPPGRSKPAGDGGIETCVAVTCEENHFVHGHVCTPCPVGYSRKAGDRSDEDDATCDKCAASHFVGVNNDCVRCDEGYLSSFFSNSSNSNETRFTADAATCDVCAKDYAVETDSRSGTFVCAKCPAGYERDSGDFWADGETRCTRCAAGHHVQKNGDTPECTPCSIGREPSDHEVHNIAKSNSTTCVPITCAGDEFVSIATCTSCPTGYLRTLGSDGDLATDGDTECTLCAENYRVSGSPATGFSCNPCDGNGVISAGGDVTRGFATHCVYNKCSVNEHVTNYTCTSCPDGYLRDAGDEPAAGDTVCQKCAEDYRADGWGNCVACEVGMRHLPGADRFGDSTKCESAAPQLGRRTSSRSEKVLAANAPVSLGDHRRQPGFIQTWSTHFVAALVLFAGVVSYSRRRRAGNETTGEENASLARGIVEARARRNYGAAL